MALIGRFFVVLFAFLIACLVAAVVLEIGILIPFWREQIGLDVDQGLFKVMVGFGFFFVSLFSLLPAMFVIAMAEAFRVRSVVFYAIAGAVEALVIVYGLGFAQPTGGAEISPFMQAFAASGIAGGLIYWLVAGRNAGRWCERAKPVA